jgi:ABC-type transport system involved in multi-copper enzyme maturation permease subunit
MEWSERLPLILAIVRKDLHAARWWIVAAAGPALTGLILTTPLALNEANMTYYYYPYRFVWYDSSLRAYYGLAALLTSIALGLAFSRVYTGEVHRGTIRSIILYPVDVEDIILAKLGSAFTIGFLVSFPIFLGFLMPFFLTGLFPAVDFLAIYFMTLVMGFVALATGVALSLIITHYAGRMAVSPSTLGSLFLLLAVLLTEQVVTTVGDYFLSLSQNGNSFLNPAAYQAVQDFARAISVLSPQHMGARILGDLFGVSALWPDVHVVVPVFVLVAVAAHLLSRRLYPDLFVR